MKAPVSRTIIVKPGSLAICTWYSLERQNCSQLRSISSLRPDTGSLPTRVSGGDVTAAVAGLVISPGSLLGGLDGGASSLGVATVVQPPVETLSRISKTAIDVQDQMYLFMSVPARCVV